MQQYSIYGVRIASEWPLDFPAAGPDALASVAFERATDAAFRGVKARATEEGSWWYRCRVLPDDSIHVAWNGLFDFLIEPAGGRVSARASDGCDDSVLQYFLFGQALSFALVRQGFEPLHAAVVAIGGHASAFIGDCAYGKSTLAAAFVQGGRRLLTDDLLMVDRAPGPRIARPGSGRIKLMPESASAFLGRGADGVRLNPHTEKRSFALDAAAVQRAPVPLGHIFVLPAPAERERITAIEIRRLSRAALAHALVRNTFNIDILDRARLARQFDFATMLAGDVAGYELRYPAGLEYLPAVRDAVVDFVERIPEEVT